jgi:RNA polymerase sigma-70 factor (ECF subfamily)
MLSSAKQEAAAAIPALPPRAAGDRLPKHAAPKAHRSTQEATSDEALVHRVAQGDRSAMHELYARRHLAIYRFVVRLSHDSATAEDVTSDTFLDVWRQADRFQGRSGALTWMFGIARFKAYSAMRARVHQEWDGEALAAIEDPSCDPASSLDQQDRGALIQRCLMKLSPQHREVIHLAYYHEKSVAEVAAIVGIPHNTVKTRMFSARRRLARLLRAAGIHRT